MITEKAFYNISSRTDTPMSPQDFPVLPLVLSVDCCTMYTPRHLCNQSKLTAINMCLYLFFKINVSIALGFRQGYKKYKTGDPEIALN